MNVNLNGRPFLLAVPERLAPIQRELRYRKAAAMLAVVSAILFVLAAFDVTLGALSSFDLACLAGAALALHFVVPVAVRRT